MCPKCMAHTWNCCLVNAVVTHLGRDIVEHFMSVCVCVCVFVGFLQLRFSLLGLLTY